MDLIYLDNNATTRPAPEVLAAVAEANEQFWGNPSSVHRFGQQARQKMELARAQVAGLIGARPAQLTFTSGGTEANNLALRGLLERPAWLAARGEGPAPTLITTPIEHSAIREPAMTLSELGVRVREIPVTIDGLVTPESLDAALAEPAAEQPDGAAVLVSIQWANNETGAVQPIRELAAVIQQHRDALREAGRRVALYLHSDATQAVGKLPVDVAQAGVDLMSFAGHKFHGPKGVGGLWARPGVRLRAVQRGGPQEREKRGGTENLPGIIGMGVAAELAAQFLADSAGATRVAALRDQFERSLSAALPNMRVNSAGAPRLWNTSNVSFPGLEAEAILLSLSERGVCASAGAACSSGSLEPSPVLLAMGLDEPVAHGSVRFSLSRYTTDAEVTRAAEIVVQVVQRLARTMPI